MLFDLIKKLLESLSLQYVWNDALHLIFARPYKKYFFDEKIAWKGWV